MNFPGHKPTFTSPMVAFESGWSLFSDHLVPARVPGRDPAPQGHAPRRSARRRADALNSGGTLCPPSTDARWADWARPVAAAFLRTSSSREDVLRFAVAHCAGVGKGQNLVTWLELEALAASQGGTLVLTPEGGAGSAISRSTRPTRCSASSLHAPP